METVTLKSELTFSESSPKVNPSLFAVDMSAMIERMKQSRAWVDGELTAEIIMNCPEKQVVLTALHEGTEIDSLQSDESITIQIIEGKLHFNTRKESVTLFRGQLFTLHEKVKYSLTTTEGTVFLITIASPKLIPPGN